MYLQNTPIISRSCSAVLLALMDDVLIGGRIRLGGGGELFFFFSCWLLAKQSVAASTRSCAKVSGPLSDEMKCDRSIHTKLDLIPSRSRRSALLSLSRGRGSGKRTLFKICLSSING